jgi:hypothetical protein
MKIIKFDINRNESRIITDGLRSLLKTLNRQQDPYFDEVLELLEKIESIIVNQYYDGKT